MLIWTTAFPLLLVAVMTPLKTIWFEERISIRSLIQETVPAINRAYVSTVLAFSGIFSLVALIFGVHLLTAFLFSDAATFPKGNWFVYLVTTMAGAVSLRVMLNLLVIPFLATGSGLTLKETLASCSHKLEGRRLTLFLIVLLGVITIITVNVLFHGFSINFTDLTMIEVGFFCFTAWYFMACLSVYSLAAAESVTTSHVQQLRSAATPIRIRHRKAKQESTKKEQNILKKLDKARRHRQTTRMSPKDMELLFR